MKRQAVLCHQDFDMIPPGDSAVVFVTHRTVHLHFVSEYDDLCDPILLVITFVTVSFAVECLKRLDAGGLKLLYRKKKFTT